MKKRVIDLVKRIAVVALFAPALAIAADVVPLDKAPVRTDNASLQNGAKIFVNYCMGCHSASFMRYNMLENIGLSSDDILNNLIFTGAGVGELMKISMQPAEAKAWFGVMPPDLTLEVRQRASPAGSGADWVYSYLRSFYRDPERPTGWNNTVFSNVGMPHVLWQWQGDVEADIVKQDGIQHVTLKSATGGTMSAAEYDKNVGDLVSFLVWMGEPTAERRHAIGYWVLAFLVIMFGCAYMLKKEFWKDVH